MHKKKRWIATALCLTLCLSGCGSTPAEETASSEPTVEVPKKIEAPGFEKTVQHAERIESGEHYEHGEDGYFLLADQGIKTKLKAQRSGTCWAHAASTSMESNYLMRTGEEIVVDPYEIVNIVYSDDKKEGVFVGKAGKMDIGGNTWFITGSLSNGFGEYFLTKSICCEGLSIEKVQEAIRGNGALSMGMSDGLNGRGYFDGYLTQYDSDNLNDHSVAAVGWDDHFPREYFKEMPSQDGAWIVQDSQMNVDYCYMSRDAEIIDSCIFELSKDYKDVVYYEAGCYDAIMTGDSTTIANIFHKEGSLAAVGVYIPEHGESVQIAVYDEKTGEKLAEEEETFDIKGYYAMPLSEPVSVKDYRIEACFSGPAPVEGESWDDYSLVYRASSEEGQSFVKVGEKWLDLAKKSTKKTLGIKFTPNNACIKGLYK